MITDKIIKIFIYQMLMKLHKKISLTLFGSRMVADTSTRRSYSLWYSLSGYYLVLDYQ